MPAETPADEGPEGELAVRCERDLVQKLKVLRHELSLQQPQAGHCRVEVSREEIFEVSQHQLYRRTLLPVHPPSYITCVTSLSLCPSFHLHLHLQAMLLLYSVFFFLLIAVLVVPSRCQCTAPQTPDPLMLRGTI